MIRSLAPSVSRRGFVGASAGTLVAALGGCSRQAPPPSSPPPLTRPEGDTDADWAHVRAQFLLDEGVAYMNNASLGMPPRQVFEAVADGYRALSREPLHGKHDLQDAVADAVLPALAGLLGVRPGELALTRNATEALHLQAIGLVLERGDEVLITTQEHPAGRRPWQFRAAREGIGLREVFVPSPLPPAKEVVDRIESQVGPRTRALAFCHVTRGGHLYPVRELCAMAKRHGLVTLVDGAQAVGQLPVGIEALGCDAYSASLHKWLLGPVSTGFLWVREEARDRIHTAFAHDATPRAPAFEPPGTVDFPVRAALAAALDFATVLGLDRIESRCRFLSEHLKARLIELPGVTLLSGPTERSCPGSTIFQMEGLDAMAAVPRMEAIAAIHLDEHQRDGHDAIRVSTHVYNRIDEIDRLIEALPRARDSA